MKVLGRMVGKEKQMLGSLFLRVSFDLKLLMEICRYVGLMKPEEGLKMTGVFYV